MVDGARGARRVWFAPDLWDALLTCGDDLPDAAQGRRHQHQLVMAVLQEVHK
ncbi:hypothetical protein [Nocardia sp. 348MFTsu5.1]|uniref:hypothetical protein n=1 Tax=Nocardia sp. 348MFTsu5.1 TaxID=1172185 RepID=UPI0003A54B5F|nr:hypothetical protein [Nocardia sp. 348MFTsu5.1]